MLEIYSLIQNIAQHFTSVLITGETGRGKELVARAIHKLSETKNRKFIVCDCVSIPENLFESELFGYTKGAFIGADKDKKGLFETADEGIIFLDEIGEIPVSIQAKLLRVLEHRQFRPLGSNETRSCHVLCRFQQHPQNSIGNEEIAMSIYLRYFLDMKSKQNPDKKLPSLEEVKNNYVSYLLDVPLASLEKKFKE